MRKVNNIKLAVLFISMCCLIYPQSISQAQAPTAPDAPNYSQQKVDKLKEGTSQTLDSALKVASSLPKLTNDLSAVRRRKKIIIQTEILKQEVVLRYQGNIYEVPLEQYKGYAIIDVDSFLSENEGTSLVEPGQDTLISKPKEVPKRSFLQKLFGK